MGTTADLAAVVLTSRELCRSLLLEDHRFLSHFFSSLVHEGSAQELEQLTSLFVGLSGGGDSDVHTTQLLDLIVLDFGESLNGNLTERSYRYGLVQLTAPRSEFLM